jgi:hypothetical protein
MSNFEDLVFGDDGRFRFLFIPTSFLNTLLAFFDNWNRAALDASEDWAGVSRLLRKYVPSTKMEG